MIKHIIIFLCSFTILSQLSAQDDPVLFTVEDTPVHVSEFKYIYTKTNGEKADFSKKSLEEYLDLYTKFKLKVQKAREMKLDTIPTLINELAGYRKQLANSYLIDREVTDKLIEEAYARSKEDVNISHIMINCSENATPADSLKAYNKIMEIKKKLDAGGDFAALAKEFSDDKSAKDNGGTIGFITALFPNGFYPLETAAYNAQVNKVAGPVRTNIAYHLLKVNEKRPARGEIEAAHILLRVPKDKEDPAAKSRIDSLHKVLKKGGNFGELAKTFSKDKGSAQKEGYIGFFGINRYERSFEDAAFALKKDGDFTKPIRSSVGWHIIKRISKKETEEFDLAKKRLQNKIQKDKRYQMAKKAMVVRIKKDSGFKEDEKLLEKFTASLDEEFMTHKWKADASKPKDVLFNFGKQKATLADFQDYCQRNSRTRMRMGKGVQAADVVNKLYKDYINDKALEHEESMLDDKYPEFKALMREYEEGILLFEATKVLVWDKASQDTVGLKAFHEKNTGKYQWKERAVVSTYTLRAENIDKLNALRKAAKSSSQDKIMKKFNDGERKVVSVKDYTFEKGQNEVLDKMKWEAGALSKIEENKRDKSLNFMKIEEVLPPGEKTLSEARGYVVADYQDFLEKDWVKSLKENYKVKVNQGVFDGLVK